MANPKLNEIAGQDNPMVARGAENFSTEYKEFLKSLNKLSGNKKVQGALTSVRDMLVALTGASKWAKATNLEVRTQLNTLINTSGNVRGIPLTDGVKEQFKRFSKLFELENRPEKIYHRYFEEVHVNPRHLTFAIEDFRKEDSPIALIATTQRRSQLLTSW